MLEEIRFIGINGKYTPSVKLPDAIKAYINEYGEDSLRDPELANILLECKQIRVKREIIKMLGKLIEDGITGWLLDAYDNDDSLESDIAEYASNENMDVDTVFYLCRMIEKVIGGTFFQVKIRKKRN